ncbi:hypothetical protein BgiMline_007628 [Biomphalaria glabrata]|nr:hypothetical protein BgiMline_023185 [Biomphalaria glabrata]
MNASKESICGMAYLCNFNSSEEFIGRLFTKDGRQYSIQGHSHTCNDHEQEDSSEDDHHACCLDETCRMMSLEVANVSDKSDGFTLLHVVRACGK